MDRAEAVKLAENFIRGNKLEPWEGVTVPVSALSTLATAVIEMAAELDGEESTEPLAPDSPAVSRAMRRFQTRLAEVTRIQALERQIAEARRLLGAVAEAKQGDYLTPEFRAWRGEVQRFLEVK